MNRKCKITARHQVSIRQTAERGPERESTIKRGQQQQTRVMATSFSINDTATAPNNAKANSGCLWLMKMKREKIVTILHETKYRPKTNKQPQMHLPL